MSSNFEIKSEEEFKNSLIDNAIRVDVVDISGSLCIGIGRKTKDPNGALFLHPLTGVALANNIISACLFIAKERNKKEYKSIETAPKDGRRLIVADDYQRTTAFWDARGFWNAAEKIEDEPISLPSTICYWKELETN